MKAKFNDFNIMQINSAMEELTRDLLRLIEEDYDSVDNGLLLEVLEKHVGKDYLVCKKLDENIPLTREDRAWLRGVIEKDNNNTNQ